MNGARQNTKTHWDSQESSAMRSNGAAEILE
jgi:hypothetical protein